MNNLIRRCVVVTVVTTMMIVSDAGGQRRIRADEESTQSSKFPSTDVDTLHGHLRQVIKDLKYSDTVADDFIKMACEWKDVRGRRVLVASSDMLTRSHEACIRGQISEAQLARIEEGVMMELGKCIRKEIRYRRDYFDLADVIEGQRANCFGYSQIFYILGNSIRLSVRAMRVTPGHIANIVGLSDDTMAVVDLTRADGFISERIITESESEGDGSYWKLEDKGKLVRENKTIHILGKNELIGEIYFCRGTINYMSSQSTAAISHYNKAIELNPASAKAYNNRGGAYLILGEHTIAISNFNEALKLSPEYTSAYHNRANAYLDSGRYTEAIIDYTNTIERDAGFAKAYFGRGFAHLALEDYAQAVSDYTRAIELNPEFARAYYMRAISHAYLTEDEKAKRDMLQAVELDRTLKEDAKRISIEFELDLNLN